jgi:hypothetical protein
LLSLYVLRLQCLSEGKAWARETLTRPDARRNVDWQWRRRDLQDKRTGTLISMRTVGGARQNGKSGKGPWHHLQRSVMSIGIL